MNIETIKQVAKDIVNVTGNHSPLLMYELNNNLYTVRLVFTDEAKQEMLNDIRARINDNNIKEYIIIIEGWIGHNINIRPSNEKVKKEGLIISKFRKDMKHESFILPFRRGENKIIWDKEINLTNVNKYSSIWNFYLEDVMDEVVAKTRLDEFYKTISKDEFTNKIKIIGDKYRKLTGEKITNKELTNILLDKVKKGLIKLK